MRTSIAAVVFFTALIQASGQTAATTAPGLPKDPQAIFAAAAPFYNFNDPKLKPWHLKATYQLYDEGGKPTEQGTYEYWWASPKVHRSSWTRASATHSDWYTADGAHAYRDTGARLKYFERNLSSAFFSPLPSAALLDPEKTRLDLQVKSSNVAKFQCISLSSLKPGEWQGMLGGSPTYCFDSQLPLLRVSYTLNILVAEFDDIVEFYGKFLARQIAIFAGN
jgi:hypothetical protein